MNENKKRYTHTYMFCFRFTNFVTIALIATFDWHLIGKILILRIKLRIKIK